MELNEMTNVIERSMKTVSNGVTRNLARTAAYELLKHYEEKANKKITWKNKYSDTDQPDAEGRWSRVCYYNGLQIAWVNMVNDNGRTMYIYKTVFPVSGNDMPLGVEVKETFEETKMAVEKLWSKFLQNLY